MRNNSDIAASKLAKQPYFHQKNNYCIYIKLGHRGLMIKIATIAMIQKNQVLQYCVIDENVPRGMTIEGLFTYLKNPELHQVDIANKTLKIKLINMQENELVDHSITLDLVTSSLSDDYFLIYYLINQKPKAKYIVKPLLVFSFVFILCLLFLPLRPKTSLGNVQHIKQQILAQTKASFQDILKEQIKKALNPINMKIQKNSLKIEQLIKEQIQIKSKFKQVVQRIELMPYEDKKENGNRYKQEIQLLSSQYNNSISRIDKMATTVQLNKLKQQIGTQRKQLQKMMNQISNKLTAQFKQYTEAMLASIKMIKQDAAEKTKKFNQLLSNKADQSKLNEISKLITTKIDQNNTQLQQAARSKTSSTNIQSQIEEIKKAVKMLSVFDLTSKNIQSFNINGNQATYKALSGRYTQLPLGSRIPFDQKLHYDFKIINSPHNSTFIGVVDALRGKQHRSSIQFHSTIAYSARGQLWKDGKKQQQAGVGYNVGDIVRMEVELSKGFLRWMVNGKMVKEIVSEKLQDMFIDYRPYVEMATKGDSIEIGRRQL